MTRRSFVSACISVPAIMSARTNPVIGSGEHTYEVIHDWGETPARIAYGNTHGIVQDTHGNVYIAHTVHAGSESRDTILVFDEKGKFIRSWGSEFKGGAHGLHLRKEGSDEYL